jgi:DNA-binding response OmpR family regulator
MKINPPRVLYVDDDEDSCEVMKMLLVNAFPVIEVQCVISGKQAIRMAGETPFDVYILDAMIPGTTGFDICKSIRKYDATVPILFYSAMSGKEERMEADESGCSSYLIKPNDMDELLRKVSEVVESRVIGVACEIGLAQETGSAPRPLTSY